MHKFIALAAFCLTGSVFAQSMCEVNLVNARGQVIQTYQSNDSYDGCKEGMKSCRFEIRQRGGVGRLNCVRAARIANPVPTPQPRPLPTPQPVPGRHVASRRLLQNGESVYLGSRIVTVIAASMDGRYVVRDSFGSVTNHVERSQLSVTTGCTYDVCVGQEIILNTRKVTVVGLTYGDNFLVRDSFGSVTNNIERSQLSVITGCAYDVCVGQEIILNTRKVTVIGITYGNDFVVRDSFGSVSTNIARDSMAILSGCIRHPHQAQICVGDQVLTRSNSYSTVIGLLNNGLVVLRDSFGNITPTVDPSNLIITR